jgi:hypothetical protein
MSGRRASGLLWGAAVLVFLFAVGWSVRSVVLSTQVTAGLTDRCRHIARLREVQARMARYDGAVAQFDALGAVSSEPLAPLVRSVFPDDRAEVRERESMPPVSGWTVRRMDVVLGEVDLQRLGLLLQKLEDGRPPWRLRECTIKASRQAPGRGKVTLVLEGFFRGGS